MKKYNDEVMDILKNAESEMFDLNHPYVGTEHLVLSLLKKEEIEEIFEKYKIDYKKYLSTLISVVGKSNIKSTEVLYTPLLRSVLDYARELDSINNINSLILLKSLLLNEEGIGIRILRILNVDIYNILEDINDCLHLKEKNN